METGAGVAKQPGQGGQTTSGRQPVSIGRIVTLNLQIPGTGGGVLSKVPAIVQNVDGGEIRLCAFTSAGTQIYEDVTQGNGPGQWDWPERT